jgi:hypothetical protein
MTSSVDALLNEAQRLYAAGDAHGALATWARVLELAPGHHAAVQYTAFVRKVLHLDDAAPPADATREPSRSVTTTTTTAPREPSRSVTTTTTTREPSRSLTTPREPSRTLHAEARPLLAISWAAIVDAADDSVLDGGATTSVAKKVVLAPSPEVAEPPPAMVVAGASAAPPAVPADDEVDDDIVVLTSPEDEPVIADAVTTPATATPSTNVASLTPPAPPAPPPAPPAAVAAPPPSGRLEERVVRQSVRFDEPMPIVGFLRASSLPAAVTAPPPAHTSVPREVTEALFPAGRPEERVVRQSLRFDEPPPVDAAPTRVRKTPTATNLPAVGEAGGVTPPPAAPSPAPPPAVEGAVPAASLSPWDEHPGPAAVVDLDAAPSGGATLGAPQKPSAPAFDQARIDTPPATLSPSDANEALMSTARELFDLGDFSGSLSKVELVLRSDPQHEGARAYLQRNESTLTKMYESKLGDMTRTPRQLIRPDEIVWVTMHHRAGFVLAQVDGVLSFHDLVDVAGVKRFDAVRILADLVTRGIIG